MSDAFAQRLAAAQDIAREAGLLARRHFENRHALQWQAKGVQDWVSEADKAVEELIRARIAAAFPDDAFLGEESGRSGGDGPVWVVDPIDGTAMFLRGIAYYCVSIAVVAEGSLEIGVIYDPQADEMFAGRRGHGATCNGRPMAVSAPAGLREAVLGIGFSNRRPTEPVSDWLKGLLSAQAQYRQLGAGALMLAHAADGRLDGYYEWQHNPWDALAGILLNREAGAWTNDFLDGNGLYDGNVVFCCPRGIQPAIADLVRAAGLPVGTEFRP